MKTNPWLLVLDLFEYEAVPAKQSLSNIQHLWQQVRKAILLSTVSDKQSVVSLIQSIVSVSRSRK